LPILAASSPIDEGNSLIVTTFRSDLSHQLLVVVAALAVLALGWTLWRAWRLRQGAGHPTGRWEQEGRPVSPEPLGRRILRIGFGLLWIFDGLLQAQSAMPVGLGSQVVQPAASGSPGWVQHLVHSGVLVWNNHPVESAVAAVWIEVGIGAWLLVAPRGRWSRAGAVVSIGWGLVVWTFGESLGGILAPGLTVLTGAPGAALLYCFGGSLVALPERSWSRTHTGRAILVGAGAFFVGMGILQAWPGRGFWQGAVAGHRAGHRAGTLAGTIDGLAGNSQPGFLSSWVSSFGSFDASHASLVNAVAVAALIAIGLGLCWGRGRPLRLAVVATCLFGLVDWVLIEDLGFLGGLGTDPNSMIPIMLVVVGGAVGLVRDAAADDPAGGDRPVPVSSPVAPAAEVTVAAGGRRTIGYVLRVVATGAAAAVVLLGAAPMAAAAANPTADPIVTEADNGAADVVDTPAPAFNLIDQDGHPVTLADLSGKALAVTFLDPVCTTDCPVIAQEFRQADQALGAAASKTDFIAIVANPLYRSRFDTDTFDHVEGLDHLSNWLYLTGSLSELDRIWAVYGAEVVLFPAGAMVDHSDISYVIDPRGHIRYITSADPGDDTSTTRSSFSGLLDQQLTSVLPAR
jgi:cytochrome oxidase Cu insertion factor (SCO1/SenC/PrrC family)